jgi:hypothetical protein
MSARTRHKPWFKANAEETVSKEGAESLEETLYKRTIKDVAEVEDREFWKNVLQGAANRFDQSAVVTGDMKIQELIDRSLRFLDRKCLVCKHPLSSTIYPELFTFDYHDEELRLTCPVCGYTMRFRRND